MNRGITKSELKEQIITELGYPIVRVELHESQLNQCIDNAIRKFKQFATGNYTQETWFTLLVGPEKNEYILPESVTEIISLYDSSTSLGQANELFTVQNLMKMEGMFDPIHTPSFTLLSWYAVKNYIKDLERFSGPEFNWKYVYGSNKLILNPSPSKQQYLLLQSYMVDDNDIEFDEEKQEYIEPILNESWIFEYSVALAKIILGRIRSKFESFQSIGNEGISLDGSDLLSEGKEAKQKLEEELDDKYSFTGYYPIIG